MCDLEVSMLVCALYLRVWAMGMRMSKNKYLHSLLLRMYFVCMCVCVCVGGLLFGCFVW